MEKLLEFVFNEIPEDATPKVIVLSVLFASFIYALSQANIIYDFVDKFNKRELLLLQELLANKNISEKAQTTLRNKIDSIVYQNVTGIKANLHLQKKIASYYELAEGRLKYSDFKKAFTFLKIDRNGILKIRKPNIFEIMWHIYLIFMSISLFAFLCLLLAALVYTQMSIQMLILLLILITIVATLLLACASQASLVPTVAKIKKEIEDNPIISQKNQAIVESRQANSANKQLRPYGLCQGEFTVPDDFDTPLPDDILSTFEYQ